MTTTMSQKRPETDNTLAGEVEISSKRLRTSLLFDDDDEEQMMMMSLNQEKSVVEIMKTLEAEMNYPLNHRMKFRSSSSSSLSSTIINGCDGESCGPYFSDSSSTVMASLDMGNCSSYLVGPTPTLTPTVEISGEDSSSSSSSSSYPPDLGLITTGEEVKNEINGCDEFEEDEDEDEWLERVLYRTPIEEEFLMSMEEEEFL